MPCARAFRSRRAPRRARAAGTRRSAPRTAPCRSTKSTVGEKKRDCRRQRGDEPSTIRSAPVSRAWSTIARPIARGRGSCSCAPRRRSPRRARRPRRARPRRAPPPRASRRRAPSSSGTRITYSASTARPCSLASLTAVATISSPMIPSFIGTRMRRKCGTSDGRLLVRRDHPLGQALAVRAADDDVDDEPDARARPGRRSARRRAWRSSRSRRANVSTAPTIAGSGISAPRMLHVERRAVRPRQVGLGDPQPDHRELRRREREQHAEREDAREEAARRGGRRRRDHDRARDHRRARRSPAARRACGGAAGRTRAAAGRARRASRRGARSRRSTSSPPRRRISAPLTPTKKRSMSPSGSGSCAADLGRDADERRAQPVGAELGVSGPGNAESATTAIATYSVTTVPIATNSERGRSTPGRRASSARFATVSSPVYASIASGSANSDRVPGRGVAERRAVRERVRREDEHEAEHDEHELRQQVERRDEEAERVERRPADEPDRRRRATITPTPTITSHGLWRSESTWSAAAEVVRHEERRERDHDQVVEEEHPAGHEAGEVVERAADEGRGAARLRQRRTSPRRTRARRAGRAGRRRAARAA